MGRLTLWREFSYSNYVRRGRVRAGFEVSGYAVPWPRVIVRVEEEVLVLAFLLQDRVSDPLFAGSIETKLSPTWRRRLARVLPVEEL